MLFFVMLFSLPIAFAGMGDCTFGDCGFGDDCCNGGGGGGGSSGSGGTAPTVFVGDSGGTTPYDVGDNDNADDPVSGTQVVLSCSSACGFGGKEVGTNGFPPGDYDDLKKGAGEQAGKLGRFGEQQGGEATFLSGILTGGCSGDISGSSMNFNIDLNVVDLECEDIIVVAMKNGLVEPVDIVCSINGDKAEVSLPINECFDSLAIFKGEEPTAIVPQPEPGQPIAEVLLPPTQEERNFLWLILPVLAILVIGGFVYYYRNRNKKLF